jgi:hypothetical protein
VYNDQVWASSDLGRTWALVTARAPWSARDTFNAEVTKAGLIVLTGGWAAEGGNANDVSHTTPTQPLFIALSSPLTSIVAAECRCG